MRAGAMHKILDRLIVIWAWISTVLILTVVTVFLGFLLYRGFGTLGLNLFFGKVAFFDALTGRVPVWHGIWPAMVGTLLLVVISTAIAVPLGSASGIYLAEYADGRLKSILSFAVDLLASTPSIIIGLFGFAFILFLRNTLIPGANVSLLAASLCLALLVLPYTIRTTQTALEGLPASTKLVGIGLGFTKLQNIRHVLLPAAGRSLFSGVILAVGRAAEDTAVILLTGVVANAGLPGSLTDKFEALPFTIFYLAAEYRTAEELDRGFGSALLLLLLTSALFAVAGLLRAIVQRGSE